VAIAPARISTRAGKAFKVPYVATTRGTVLVEIVRRRKTRATVAGRVRVGRNNLKVPKRVKPTLRSKARARPLPAGRYTLRLTVTDAGGRTAVDTVRLTVSRARR
jgi:hypothetical protein